MVPTDKAISADTSRVPHGRTANFEHDNLVCDVLHSESCSEFKDEGDTGQDVDTFFDDKVMKTPGRTRTASETTEIAEIQDLLM